MKNLYFILMIFLVGLSSCEKEDINRTIADAKLINELKTSPETIKLGNNNLVLETFVWRDFMPVSPPTGSKMIAVGKLKDVGQVSIPQGVVLKKNYVIHGDEVWVANYGQIRNEPSHVLEGVVRDGPQWEVGIEVDVVCEFQHHGKTYRILAKAQLLHATH